jgi:hypothetical protein
MQVVQPAYEGFSTSVRGFYNLRTEVGVFSLKEMKTDKGE